MPLPSAAGRQPNSFYFFLALLPPELPDEEELELRARLEEPLDREVEPEYEPPDEEELPELEWEPLAETYGLFPLDPVLREREARLDEDVAPEFAGEALSLSYRLR